MFYGNSSTRIRRDTLCNGGGLSQGKRNRWIKTFFFTLRTKVFEPLMYHGLFYWCPYVSGSGNISVTSLSGSERSRILSKIFKFVLRRWMNVIQVWNDTRVRNEWHHFHFWVNYPFKLALIFIFSVFILISLIFSNFVLCFCYFY